jgi:hypothetical protein
MMAPCRGVDFNVFADFKKERAMDRTTIRRLAMAAALGAAIGCAESGKAGGGAGAASKPAPEKTAAKASPEKKAAKKPAPEGGAAWQDSFNVKACTLSATGRNDYFILEPGHQVVLGLRKGAKSEQVLITVLDKTEVVDGVETRIVEEREFANDKIKEVSRNFFAICKEHKDVFYFGEEVDDYKDGKIVGHGGAWRAGEKGAKAGLMMPGTPSAGLKHYQEIAPGVAMDRAEIRKIDDTVKTPAGSFEKCLEVVETSPLEPGQSSKKEYAPGIGMIRDEDMKLICHGKSLTGPVEIPESAAKEKKAKKKDKKAKPEGTKAGKGATKEKPAKGAEFSEVEITFEEMPADLGKKVMDLHPAGKVKEVKRETHGGGKVIYAVEVMVGTTQYDVEITEKGKVVRNEAEK